MGRVPDVQEEEEEEEGCAQSTPGAGTGGFRALTKLPLITDPFLPLAGTKKKKKKKNPRNSFLAPQKKNPGRTERKPEAAEEREMFSNILWIIIILKYFVTIPVVKFLQHGLSACSALSLQDPGLLKGR